MSNFVVKFVNGSSTRLKREVGKTESTSDLLCTKGLIRGHELYPWDTLLCLTPKKEADTLTVRTVSLTSLHDLSRCSNDNDIEAFVNGCWVCNRPSDFNILKSEILGNNTLKVGFSSRYTPNCNCLSVLKVSYDLSGERCEESFYLRV
jgi:hypothetical protein